MSLKQRGFGSLELLLLIAIVLAVGFAGGYLAHKNQSVVPKPVPANQQKITTPRDSPAKAGEITISLFDTDTGKPIAHTGATVSSSNGVLCTGEGCDTNDKTWIGTTNGEGVVSLPKEYVQRVTAVTAKGYFQASLPYDPDASSYRVKLNYNDQMLERN